MHKVGTLLSVLWKNVQTALANGVNFGLKTDRARGSLQLVIDERFVNLAYAEASEGRSPIITPSRNLNGALDWFVAASVHTAIEATKKHEPFR